MKAVSTKSTSDIYKEIFVFFFLTFSRKKKYITTRFGTDSMFRFSRIFWTDANLDQYYTVSREVPIIFSLYKIVEFSFVRARTLKHFFYLYSESYFTLQKYH